MCKGVNSRTFYEKYGFTNETHSSPAAKKKIEELRKTTTLKDLAATLQSLPLTVIKSQVRGVEFGYPPKTHTILSEIDKLITSDDPYKHTLDKMPLEYFIRTYLISICEGTTAIGASTYEVINNIVEDINLFLKTKGFDHFDFIKYYPEVDDKPEILVYPDEDIVNIYINTNKEGGKRINRKNRIRKIKSRKSINRKSRSIKMKSRKMKSRKMKSRKIHGK